MEEQHVRLATPRAQQTNNRETNDRDTYVKREEDLIFQAHQPVDVKVFFRKDAQGDGSVRCKVCVEIGGAEYCRYVDCESIVIKPKAIVP